MELKMLASFSNAEILLHFVGVLELILRPIFYHNNFIFGLLIILMACLNINTGFAKVGNF